MAQKLKILLICLLLVLLGFFSFLVLKQKVNQSLKAPCLDCFVSNTENMVSFNTYQDSVLGFKISYPADYQVDTNYQYQGLGLGKEIKGVKFIIPISLATGTNLSSYDTGVSVETIPLAEKCEANLFLSDGIGVQEIVDYGVSYSFAQVKEGAAGNFYEEQVWALKDSSPCFAIRYLVHSTNIQNYPEGMVTEFDEAALLDVFHRIRRSFTRI